MEISFGVLIIVQFFAGLMNLIAGLITIRFGIKYKEERKYIFPGLLFTLAGLLWFLLFATNIMNM